MKSRQRISVTTSQRLQLTLGLQASIRVLKADAAGLTRYLAEQAAENPALQLAPPPQGDWLPRWDAMFRTGAAAVMVEAEHLAEARALYQRVLARYSSHDWAYYVDQAKEALAGLQDSAPAVVALRPSSALSR